MKIPDPIEYIEVYYDGRCGMCCLFQEWLSRQNRAFPVRFAAYQSERAEQMFPGISRFEPSREMIVRADSGELFRGAHGWVLCLFSCVKFQRIARRLASPTLLPFAEKTCLAIAARRRGVSRVFFRRKDREVAAKLHSMPDDECAGGCHVEGESRIPDGII